MLERHLNRFSISTHHTFQDSLLCTRAEDLLNISVAKCWEALIFNRYRAFAKFIQGTTSQEFICHGIQLMATTLIAHGVLSDTLDSEVDLSTAAGLVDCLLKFLKGRYSCCKWEMRKSNFSSFRAYPHQNGIKVLFRSSGIRETASSSHSISQEYLQY